MNSLTVHGSLTIGPYLGYHGRAEYDPGDDDFHGEVIGTRDTITFVGKTPAKVQAEFRTSVDDYLEFCKSLDRKPEKPYSGKFVVRIDPELHRELSILADKLGTSLNQFVADALDRVVGGEDEPGTIAASTSAANDTVEESDSLDILSMEQNIPRLIMGTSSQSSAAQ